MHQDSYYRIKKVISFLKTWIHWIKMNKNESVSGSERKKQLKLTEV